jgi:signal transduction histidine kinase
MLRKQIPTLMRYHDTLSEHKVKIVESWVERDLVLDVLQKHDIDVKLFETEYAIKILDYFFDVVAQKKEIGDCPVMAKLLAYLKERDIAADELFLICTHARKAMIEMTYDLGLNSKDLFWEISYVFDLNFRGVLSLYANTIYRLEKQVLQEIEKNREKDAVMFQQARLAAMGEMIGNIAHQWRQPITMISAIIQNVRFKASIGKLTNDFIKSSTDQMLDVTKHMSQTIDDFRDFFHPNKEKEAFFVDASIKHALEIYEKNFENDNIKVVTTYEHVSPVVGFKNEFAQTILNLLSNARDIVVEKRDPDYRYIFIKVRQEDNRVFVCIQDSGGGIADSMIKKVFDPYFTTKDEGKGTGVGLYMSKQIIENSMQGTLRVKNSTIDHNGVTMFGAKFSISLQTSNE